MRKGTVDMEFYIQKKNILQEENNKKDIQTKKNGGNVLPTDLRNNKGKGKFFN